MREPMLDNQGVTRALLLTGLLLSVAVSAIYLIHPLFIASTNKRTTDMVMAMTQAKPASGSVVIVDIDEKSLDRYGQWPWSRSRLARLLTAIDQAGAATIGLDLILAEPDRGYPRETYLNRQSPTSSRIASNLSDADRELTKTLAEGPFVLGYEFLFENSPRQQIPCGLHPPGLVWIYQSGAVRDRSRFFTALGVVCNRHLFSDAVTYSGFLNATPDADGILRRVPMLIRFNDRLYPSLALAMLMRHLKSNQIEILDRKNGSFDLMVGNRSISVDSRGNMTVQFSRAARMAPRVSAGDLLSGKPVTATLKGKIVLVGTSAAGLEPSYQTSVGPVHTHAEVHAQVLDNLLTGRRVIRPRQFLLWEVLVGLLVAAITGLCVAGMGILASAAICLTFLAGSWLGMVLLFQADGYLLSPLLPTALALSNFAALTIAKNRKIQLNARAEADRTLTLLKSSEKNLNSIVKAVPDVIFRLDPGGRITFISPAIAKYSASPADLLGQPMLNLIKSAYRDAFERLTDDVLHGLSGHLEFEAANPGKRELWLDTHVVPFRDDTGEVVSLLGVARDITDRKLAEKALAEKRLQLEELNKNLEQRVAEAVLDLREKDRILIQQGRQAAMGEMIGNIAHQWRQPLNTLGLIVQELRMTYGSDAFNKESLEASVKKSMGLILHMSQTIEDFSNYFKPDKEKRLFNVNQSVAKTLSLVEPSMKSLSIDVKVIAADAIHIEGYSNEYSQVLLNILLNCRDAFEGGAADRQRVITIAVFRENDRSVVTVTDNAGGVQEGVIDKIFDPYFTTKGPDKGTGIGLFMAKTIIEKNMGGRLTVRNTQDGAQFRIEV